MNNKERFLLITAVGMAIGLVGSYLSFVPASASDPVGEMFSVVMVAAGFVTMFVGSVAGFVYDLRNDGDLHDGESNY